MSKIRIWSRACFAIGPGASRDGKIIDSFITVPGAFQDMDERYAEDPTFKAAVASGDIQVMTAKAVVAQDVPHVDVPSVDSNVDTPVDPVEEYKEKVKAMSAEEVASECEKYGAEFVNSDKLKDNKRRLMEAFKLSISDNDDEE
jgi:hypothetical protein